MKLLIAHLVFAAGTATLFLLAGIAGRRSGMKVVEVTRQQRLDEIRVQGEFWMGEMERLHGETAAAIIAGDMERMHKLHRQWLVAEQRFIREFTLPMRMYEETTHQ